MTEHHSRVARNTLNNISVLVFCYVFCWLPFHMYQLLQINGLNVSNDNCNWIEEIVKMYDFFQLLSLIID